VRVDLRGGEVLVAEELLDDPQVGTAVEEMGRERMPQRVRRDALGQAGGPAQPVESRAVIAGLPSNPMRSLRPLPSTRISPRPKSTEPSSAAASSLMRSPAA
jgi:hypothetical protein